MERQFGSFETKELIELQTATQEVVQGTVCGPVKIKVEGFRAIYNEVLFLDMEPNDGEYEPLLGSIVLEQCGAAVDIIGHRLLPVKYMDAKPLLGWLNLVPYATDLRRGRNRGLRNKGWVRLF